MKRLLLLASLFTLYSSPVLAGYEVRVNPQITPQYIWVNGANGPERKADPRGSVVPPNLLCRPADYSVFSPTAARRTEVVRTPAGTATTAEVLTACPTILDTKYDRLWKAAHDWEQRYISGVGLSILSLGVAQAKPKALAVAAWSNRLWIDYYYPRKALVSIETEPDYDFSPAGEMPYSVPELAAEVYGP